MCNCALLCELEKKHVLLLTVDVLCSISARSAMSAGARCSACCDSHCVGSAAAAVLLLLVVLLLMLLLALLLYTAANAVSASAAATNSCCCCHFCYKYCCYC
jgi:hypothetical protein